VRTGRASRCTTTSSGTTWAAWAHRSSASGGCPGSCARELITAIAITEPGAGSDLRRLRTVAALEGDHYVVNGQKTFISNGQLCDLVIVVARTEPGAGYRGLSLLVVERGMPGFTRGRNLDKIGMPAQDTSELFFSDVRVPKTNLLGGRGAGILALMQNLPRERLAIGGSALPRQSACSSKPWSTPRVVRHSVNRSASCSTTGSC
jgi:long-chain-acyl-CoA dehydrogenase